MWLYCRSHRREAFLVIISDGDWIPSLEKGATKSACEFRNQMLSCLLSVLPQRQCTHPIPSYIYIHKCLTSFWKRCSSNAGHVRITLGPLRQAALSTAKGETLLVRKVRIKFINALNHHESPVPHKITQIMVSQTHRVSGNSRSLTPYSWYSQLFPQFQVISHKVQLPPILNWSKITWRYPQIIHFNRIFMDVPL